MKFTVVALEYPKDQPPLTTEGTMAEAILAYQKARGLEGLNLQWGVTDEAGKVTVIPKGTDPKDIGKPPVPVAHAGAVAAFAQTDTQTKLAKGKDESDKTGQVSTPTVDSEKEPHPVEKTTHHAEKTKDHTHHKGHK